MVSILAHAQNLVYTLLSLMPSTYQQENLEAMLGLFLQAQGSPLPQHSKSKSASALSRFLNIYNWSTIGVIRATRNRILKEILSECPLGRKAFLQVINVSRCVILHPFLYLPFRVFFFYSFIQNNRKVTEEG